MLEDHTLTIEPQLRDSELEELARCLNMNVEVTKEGKIRVMSPEGSKSSDANSEINRQLRNWWHTHKQGRVFDSNTLFTLPDGSKLGPDAAYLSAERLAKVPPDTLDGFPPVCPNFVIELLSQSDSLRKTTKKMHDWIANGVELGWLIDPYGRRVYTFAPERKTVVSDDETRIEGTGRVARFTLDLTEVWAAYK